MFSYWTSEKKEVIDKCIETFELRLRLDEECRDNKRRAKQVERAKRAKRDY